MGQSGERKSSRSNRPGAGARIVSGRPSMSRTARPPARRPSPRASARNITRLRPPSHGDRRCRVGRQQGDRGPGDIAQAGAAVAVVRNDLAAHSGVPEPAQVVGHVPRRLRPVRLATPEARDVVGHRDQSLNPHSRFRLPVRAPALSYAWAMASPFSSRSCSSVNSRCRFCHADGCVTRTTSTAVTLYSGQLVAQSEFSVVTTLAPESGKWKVVYTTPGAIRCVTL